MAARCIKTAVKIAAIIIEKRIESISTNIFFVTEFDYARKSEIQGNAVYESFVKHKTGIHLGGNADIQNILDFSQIKYSELKNIEKPGTGYISSDGKAIKVTVPFVGK